VIDHGCTTQHTPEVSVNEVELFESEVRMSPRGFEVLVFARALVKVGEAVDARDLVAKREEPLTQV